MRNYKHICDNIENVENYYKAKADNFKGWICHHRLETHTSDGEKRLIDITHEELKALDMYYHRPANELIFLTTDEHNHLHHKGKKYRPHSDEELNKMSKALKGEKNPMYGKHHSEETKRKIAESEKGKKMSEEAKRKISDSNKGKHFGPSSEEWKRNISKAWDYNKHFSKETRKKMSKAIKELHWYNNGEINTRAKTCPEGFVPGRLKI